MDSDSTSFSSRGTRLWRGGGSQSRGRGRGGLVRGGFQRFSSSSFSATSRGGRPRAWKTPFTSTPTTPEPPLGLLLSSLSKADLSDAAVARRSEARITECKVVASYNWLDSTAPTILVPGKPAKWTPPSEPPQLKADSGEYFRDPNSANYPKHPIEPMIRATLAMQPAVVRQTDIVACGSTIGNLLRFVRGEDKKFRILVESVGDTVFFIRRENSPRELIPDVWGYGHTFPEAYTSWPSDVKGSKSHQRVLSYRFGGLRFLLRFQGDGYFAPPQEKKTEKLAEAHDSPKMAQLDADALLDKLSSDLDQHRVSGTSPTSDDEQDLTVMSTGDLVDQEHIFELKTRSIRRKLKLGFEDTFSDQLPRLWVAQVPRMILAYHTDGLFEEDDIEVRDTREPLQAWEKEHVDDLSRLAALLHRIVELVSSRPKHKLELRYDAVGVLEVREQLEDAGDVLSTETLAMWQQQQSRQTSETSISPVDDYDDNYWESRSEQSDRDYTACSADHCGYCGKCSY